MSEEKTLSRSVSSFLLTAHSSLSTNIMSQHYPKIELPYLEIYIMAMYQNLCTRRHLQGETPNQGSAIHVHTPFVNILDGYVVQFRRFCCNIMCTADPNGNLWLKEVTGIDRNGCDMPNDSNFALFWWGAVGPHRGKIKNWRFRRYLW